MKNIHDGDETAVANGSETTLECDVTDILDEVGRITCALFNCDVGTMVLDFYVVEDMRVISAIEPQQ